ncbi:hypothetical protein GGI07_003936 [Coemansia sp. Benny D115]|nr:hypothetical protein GGI07_003936 [Coemansia sp. Benny D115]
MTLRKKTRLAASLKALKQQKTQLDAQRRRAQAQSLAAAGPVTGTKKTGPKLSNKIPYTANDTILLVGEGNFSFAHSLAKRLGTAANIVATAYDSEDTVLEKYTADAQAHIQALRDLGGLVLFNVDGTQLQKHDGLRDRRFSHVVFNFPHAGAGIKDQDKNVETNKVLMMGFFASASTMLAEGSTKPGNGANSNTAANNDDDESDADESDDEPSARRPHRQRGARKGAAAVETIEFDGVQAEVTYGDNDGGLGSDSDSDQGAAQTSKPKKTARRSGKPGQIHVTLKSGLPYSLWNIRQLAKDAGLMLSHARPFNVSAYPGYEHRRTLGFKDGVSKDENREITGKDPQTHVFVAKPPQTDSEPKPEAVRSTNRGVAEGKRKKHRPQTVGVNSESYDGGKARAAKRSRVR